MTIKIGSYKVTIFKVEKSALEQISLNIDNNKRSADVQSIVNSASFAELAAKAKALRAERNS